MLNSKQEPLDYSLPLHTQVPLSQVPHVEDDGFNPVVDCRLALCYVTVINPCTIRSSDELESGKMELSPGSECRGIHYINSSAFQSSTPGK